jgi:hypothetical protein
MTHGSLTSQKIVSTALRRGSCIAASVGNLGRRSSAPRHSIRRGTDAGLRRGHRDRTCLLAPQGSDRSALLTNAPYRGCIARVLVSCATSGYGGAQTLVICGRPIPRENGMKIRHPLFVGLVAAFAVSLAIVAASAVAAETPFTGTVNAVETGQVVFPTRFWIARARATPRISASTQSTW